jgi:hypothetical protein
MATRRTFHAPLPICLAILQASLSLCSGQQVSSIAVTNGVQQVVSVPAGQRVEFVSLEPLLSYEQSEVVSTATTRRGSRAVRETDSTVRNAGPRWEVIYLAGSGTSTRLVLSSDTVRTNTVSTLARGEERVTTSTRTTLRKALPDVIIGPASFRIFPQAGQAFMLNFRLRNND